MFAKILIANRGEIACRIIRTARRMGVRTVAVFSDADADARHVRLADEAVHIGASPARESYLVANKLIAAAQRAGAEAIHPGYGFLSENAAFAQSCARAGLVFIGPPVDAIRAMGSKAQAKSLMQAAGVPLTPGYHGDEQSVERLSVEAERIGYPVLIKASAGGGGKGMRRVDAQADFAPSLASCQREALASFSDARVLIERYVTRPRHIEIQVFCDSHGGAVALFERDCSVQRRHQKVLEEAPAPGFSAARRRAMSEAALLTARAVGYVGAGTVEFIVDEGGAFFFMEMNTRLQVEHPVTEMITGLDLVEWQLRVACGEKLPLTQDEIAHHGHAIEARIYAEDPAKGFLPSIGKLAHLSLPAQSAHIRIDAGVEEGDAISPFYDPMIAKLIVWDESRAKALSRLSGALGQVHIAGVANNVAFLARLVASSSFANADLDTGLIERESAALFPPEAGPPEEAFLVAALAQLASEAGDGAPAAERDGWRLNARLSRELIFEAGEKRQSISVGYLHGGYRLRIGEREVFANGRRLDRARLAVEFDGRREAAVAVAAGRTWQIFARGGSWRIDWLDPFDVAADQAHAHGGLVAPMPGRVVAILAKAGERVDKGAPLVVLEAMKMEHRLTAPSAGVVKALNCALDETVGEGVTLVDFEAEP